MKLEIGEEVLIEKQYGQYHSFKTPTTIKGISPSGR